MKDIRKMTDEEVLQESWDLLEKWEDAQREVDRCNAALKEIDDELKRREIGVAA